MKVRSALLFILFFFSLQAFSQQDSLKLNTIIAITNQVAESRPIEKVYMHFDKPYYAIGDTIWFKAYLTSGLHQPLELSKIIYVDIISSGYSLVKTLMLPVTNGTSIGSIALTEPLFKQDSYHIKAYTKWMVNFDQAYFFNKTINVGDINKEVSTFISLKRSLSNNIPRINADIIYKDAEGAPYANKKVSWNVASGLFNAIGDGKGTTDQNGLLNLNFLNSKPSDLTKAILTTTLEAGKNKNYEQAFSLKSLSSTADVQFFPEGGNLINGIPTKVAVKAVQSNGLGADFTATITDNAGNTIVTCNAQHAGMGLFVLTPQSGKSYKMNVDFKDGSKGTYDLPKIQAAGFTLTVNNTDTGKIVVKMIPDSSYLKSHLNNIYYLVGKSGHTICYAAQIRLSNTSYSVSIASSKFPSGIAQFTLLTSSGQPLSERIAFIKHQDQLNITLGSDKKSYGPRQKVLLNILSKNNLTPAAADLSISVIDESKVPFDENAETTILTSLLLTSDLKGYIENPNYYFNKTDEKTRADLDLLMLTQGYRRFVYQETLTNKVPNVSFLPEQGIEITGSLRSINGMSFKGGRVTLQIPDRYFTAETVSDGEGRFKFSNLIFTDSAKVIVHARNNVNAKNLMLMIDGTPHPAPDINPNYPEEKLNIDTTMTVYLQNVKKRYVNSNVLKEVEISAKAVVKGPTHEDYTSLNGLSSMSAQVIPADRLKECKTMVSCLRVLAFGTTFDANTNEFYVTREYESPGRLPMALAVKGVFMEFSYLNSLNPEEISSVEVFLKDEMGLVDRGNRTRGVIVINMKPAAQGTNVTMQQLQDMLPQPNVVKITPNGYNISKQFYSPKYTPGNSSFGPDLRTTIYWNPRLFADNAGKSSVEFYSSDGKGTYRAVVEGIDKDGHIGYSVYRFKVE